MIVIEIISIIFIFLVAIFTVWYFGKKEFLPEERTIDLILISALVGLIAARIAFFYSPIGQVLFNSIIKIPNTFWLIIELFNLRTGMNELVGLISFSVISFGLVLRWKWFVWPIWAVCIFSALIFVTLIQGLFFVINQTPINPIQFAIFIIIECTFILIYRLNGIIIAQEIGKMLKEKINIFKKRLPSNPNSDQPTPDN